MGSLGKPPWMVSSLKVNFSLLLSGKFNLGNLPKETVGAGGGGGWIFFQTELVILKKNLKNAFILKEVLGSDHCPIGIDISF